VSGVRVRLRVVPGAARDEVVGRHGEAWKVRVAAAPERGAANDALVRLLAVDRRDVALVSGHGARDKMVELTGLTAAEVESRLASAGRKDGAG
jgi:uncharacterized protein (TIGR00251 family)